MSYLKEVKDFARKMNRRDLVLILLYFPIFTIIGVLFKTGVIPYPKKIDIFFLDMFTQEWNYLFYDISFLVITVMNMVTFFSFAAPDGFIGYLKRKSYGNNYRDEMNREKQMLGSMLCLLVSLMVNLFVFPFYAVIYIVFGVIIAFMYLSK